MKSRNSGAVKVMFLFIAIGFIPLISFKFYLDLKCKNITVQASVDKVVFYNFSRKAKVNGHFYLDGKKYIFSDNIPNKNLETLSPGIKCLVKFCPLHDYFNKHVVVGSIGQINDSVSINNNLPASYNCTSIPNSKINIIFKHMTFLIVIWTVISFGAGTMYIMRKNNLTLDNNKE